MERFSVDVGAALAAAQGNRKVTSARTREHTGPPLHVDFDCGVTAPVFLTAAFAGTHIVRTAGIGTLP